ncbi:hypothetical protein [Haloactinomyces albus]|uniref:Uncharacterized protein n=1 Tax=Haloactinomyces albus TaxID=1352928 RepID=A0AAE4CQV6_9ACTN|nr:hypothetical protein [Haloactinomyces albus]MDR7304497.1 hypothetical protein [Haloactinomyces albus]
MNSARGSASGSTAGHGGVLVEVVVGTRVGVGPSTCSGVVASVAGTAGSSLELGTNQATALGP